MPRTTSSQQRSTKPTRPTSTVTSNSHSRLTTMYYSPPNTAARNISPMTPIGWQNSCPDLMAHTPYCTLTRATQQSPYSFQTDHITSQSSTRQNYENSTKITMPSFKTVRCTPRTRSQSM